MLKKKIKISRRIVAGKILKDFPFQVSFQNKALTEVRSAGAFYFTAPDGKTKLAHEVQLFDASRGRLVAWVKLPRLTSSRDAIIFLGADSDGKSPKNAAGVWDEKYSLVIHDCARPKDSTLNQQSVASLHLPHAPSSALLNRPRGIKFGSQITVEAWADCPAPRAETIQVLAAQWKLRDHMTRKAFDAYDAGKTDGLDTTGFFGAVFDGRYIYFSPQHDLQNRHGKVLRYDTHGDFREKTSWEAYDAGHTNSLTTKGYYGAVFDGRYVFFVPRRDPDGYHTRVLRYDTQGGFKDKKSWQAYDVGLPHSCQSAAFDGRYIYFCPGSFTRPKTQADQSPTDGTVRVTGMSADIVAVATGVIIRYDTKSEFTDKKNWVAYDAAGTSGLDTRDFDGAVFDGRYVYFMPLSFSAVLRYDTRGDFQNGKSWQAYSIARFKFTRSVGGVFDGRYIYIVPYGDCPIAVRYDTQGAFSDDKSWSGYEISQTPGLKISGYDGAAFDGRYVYYIPYYRDKTLHGVMLRYDTTKDFAAPSGWSSIDAGSVNGLPSCGFNAGATDGRYLFFAPWNHPNRFPAKIGGNGCVLRYDLLEKGSFCLRFSDLGHNGGLNAALPGPRFYVNTRRGPISIAANKAPPAGRHHFAGVYDGAKISLYIDGELAHEQKASGKISASDAKITIGCLENNAAIFPGAVTELRISSVARKAEWIKTQYRNQSKPSLLAK